MNGKERGGDWNVQRKNDHRNPIDEIIRSNKMNEGRERERERLLFSNATTTATTTTTAPSHVHIHTHIHIENNLFLSLFTFPLTTAYMNSQKYNP